METFAFSGLLSRKRLNRVEHQNHKNSSTDPLISLVKSRAHIYQASQSAVVVTAEFMKCTPAFKLKYKSKLLNSLMLRITVTHSVI